jgi:hypothetical protein
MASVSTLWAPCTSLTTWPKITADGQLSVIAGNGTGGHPTYGGLATATSLDLPLAIVVDPAGNVYVADALNFTIDRLTPSAPVSTAGPAITGSPQVGQTLSTDGGSWGNAPFTESYQWEDCDAVGAGCTTIPGATSASYAVTDGDRGHTIRVVVTALNGGGSSSASSAATALVADNAAVTIPAPDPPSSTPSPATTTTPGPVLATTAPAGSGPARSLAATLTGEVSPSTAPITYRFEYGTHASYGRSTRSQTLAPSGLAQTVRANVRGLVPGTVYHYRLVATTPSDTSYGHDATLGTPKAQLRRVRGHITPYHATQAPYRFRLRGWMRLPAGLTRSVACRSGGNRDRHGDARRPGSRHTPHAREQGLQLRQHRGLHGRTAARTRTPVLPHELRRQSSAHRRPRTHPPRGLRVAP